MKEIECKKCGNKYDANYKACPHCGDNPFRNLMKVILITLCVFMIVATFANSIATLVLQNKTLNKMDNLIINNTSANNGTNQDAGIDIRNYPEIMNKYLINDQTDLTTLGDDYFLYFFQDNCINCEISNQYVVSYNVIGINEHVPLYLVDTNTGNGIFDQFSVDGTPTLIRMTNQEEAHRYVGYEEVFEGMDAVVSLYNK